MPHHLSTSSPTFSPPPAARHYHSDLSIWLSVDPMSDKYPGVSPYTYCANNPVRLVDPDGRTVVTSEEGLEIIRKTVSSTEAQYIRLTEDGRIDKELLNQCEHNEGNIAKLKEIVNRSEIVNFVISDRFEYKTETGVETWQMGEIWINDLGPEFRIYGLYDLSTNEYGHQGQSQYPNGTGWGASVNGEYNVIINKNLSFQGKAEITGHELYGHIYLELNGYESGHMWGSSNQETNLMLKEAICASMREIQSYFNQK